MHKLKLWLLFILAGCMVPGYAQTGLLVNFTSGAADNIPVASISKITFKDSQLIISKTDGIADKSDLQIISKIVFNNGPDALPAITHESRNLFSLYPIPLTGDQLQVQMSGKVTGPLLVEVTDLTGSMLLKENKETSSGTFSISLTGVHLPAGMYMCTVTNGQFRESKFFIISR